MLPPLLDSKLFLISLIYLLFSLFDSLWQYSPSLEKLQSCPYLFISFLEGYKDLYSLWLKKIKECLLGCILYNNTLRFFWANISCSFTKLLVLLRLNFWLKFWLKLFGVVNLYILLSLFLINASTDLAQIFKRPSLCYVSYVC